MLYLFTITYAWTDNFIIEFYNSNQLAILHSWYDAISLEITFYSFTNAGESKGASALTAAKQFQNQMTDISLLERDSVKAMGEWASEASKLNMTSSHVCNVE